MLYRVDVEFSDDSGKHNERYVVAADHSDTAEDIIKELYQREGIAARVTCSLMLAKPWVRID